MIRAIVRAQTLSMRLLRPGAGRRGMVFSLAVAIIWYGFWATLAQAAYESTSSGDMLPLIGRYLPLGYLLALLYWQLAPMLSAGLGASLDLRKLLVYPVPHGKLFLAEVALRISSGGEIILVLAGGTAGLAANPVLGGWRALPRLIVPVLLFIVFNLLLAAGLRSALERVLARRRVREIAVLLLLVALASPRLLYSMGVRWSQVEPWLAHTGPALMPWSAAAQAQLGQGVGLALAGWCLLAALFSRRQFERTLRFDAQAAQATVRAERQSSWAERFFRLPGLVLPDPLAALVEKELRALARTPRFRTVFIMGFTFGLVIWLPLALGGGHDPDRVVAENFLVVVSIYALMLLGQVSYWNSFGFDRSAAQFYFASPVSIWKALAGKNLAAALYILIEVAAVTAATLALRVRIPPQRIFEAFTVTPICALYMLSLGNLASVHFPRAMTPERVAQGGSSSRVQGLVFLLFPITLLPVVLAYLARYAFASEAAFWAVLSFAAALGAAFYWVGMESAVSAALKRREAIIAELSRGEGPVVTL
ncbi:MAG: hypothetical protein ACE15B_04710 [Bryobacteraceae bacterium]